MKKTGIQLGFIASVLLLSCTSSHYIVQEGHSIVLPCGNEHRSRAAWSKQQKQGNFPLDIIRHFGDNKINVYPPWSLEDVELVSGISLKIKSASYPRDDGTFECIPDGVGKTELVVLDVLADVKTVTLSSPEFPVPENTEVTFTCEAEGGNPAPNITWEIPETLTQPEPTVSDFRSQITLTLTKDMNEQDLGCRAEQGERTLTDSIRLYVTYKPTTEIRIVPVEYSLGHTVTLTCLADGNPDPVITWRFGGNCVDDNMPIENTRDRNIATEVNNGEITRDEEQIPGCMKYNIMTVGSNIDHTHVESETGENSNGKANRETDAEAIIRNASVGQANLSSMTYQIARLNQSQTGTYICLAVNSEGNDTAFTNLTLNATNVEELSTPHESPSWLTIGVMLASFILSLLIIGCCIYYLSS